MAVDKNGNELAVGDHVSLNGYVSSITDANAVVVTSYEINYPTSTTAPATVSANGRILVKN